MRAAQHCSGAEAPPFQRQRCHPRALGACLEPAPCACMPASSLKTFVLRIWILMLPSKSMQAVVRAMHITWSPRLRLRCQPAQTLAALGELETQLCVKCSLQVEQPSGRTPRCQHLAEHYSRPHGCGTSAPRSSSTGGSSASGSSSSSSSSSSNRCACVCSKLSLQTVSVKTLLTRLRCRQQAHVQSQIGPSWWHRMD